MGQWSGRPSNDSSQAEQQKENWILKNEDKGPLDNISFTNIYRGQK